MATDTGMFEKLLRTTARVLDPEDPKKRVVQDVVDALDKKKEA